MVSFGSPTNVASKKTRCLLQVKVQLVKPRPLHFIPNAFFRIVLSTKVINIHFILQHAAQVKNGIGSDPVNEVATIRFLIM